MASLFILAHDKLILDLLLQLCHVGNNSDQLGSASHILEHTDRLISGMVIQRSEALVDEHHVQVH